MSERLAGAVRVFDQHVAESHMRQGLDLRGFIKACLVKIPPCLFKLASGQIQPAATDQRRAVLRVDCKGLIQKAESFGCVTFHQRGERLLIV